MNNTTTTQEESKRQENIEYIKRELRKLSCIRTVKTLQENIVKEENIVFTDIANCINKIHGGLEQSIYVLELWNLEKPYLHLQTDACISLIIDILP